MYPLWVNLLSLQLLAEIWLSGARVSDSFKDCSQFLYMRTAPTGINTSDGSQSSTYTLTIVVLQITDFLDETRMSTYLNTVRHQLNNFCRGKQTYMISGVTVSGATIRRGTETRIGIPKHLWLATYTALP
ncbi:hypothetical protein DPEC_G00104470 [Dallia pectoralis]|uniref:Uncharacterized protein n=1 Tax=Dallia pectoralis TaxID=75939 RepID=A0ACC2GXF2_DALPE|nr:hypothetical protein DPEC_G00104470 [Dallia pectoralis]